MSDKEFSGALEPDDSLNWADYCDALTHQDGRKNVRVSHKIKGRRLRDALRDEVEYSKLVHPLLTED